MSMFKLGAAILALAIPGAALAAVDGSPGTTSTGSFNVTMNVAPPSNTTTVQVLGLDDFDFGTIQTSNSSFTSVVGTSAAFCLNRSDAGNVRVQMSQANVPIGDAMRISNPTGEIGINVSITNPDNGGSSFNAGTVNDYPRSGAGCTAATGVAGNAHVLSVNPYSLPSYGSTPLSGQFNGTIMVTLSIP